LKLSLLTSAAITIGLKLLNWIKLKDIENMLLTAKAEAIIKKKREKKRVDCQGKQPNSIFLCQLKRIPLVSKFNQLGEFSLKRLSQLEHKRFTNRSLVKVNWLFGLEEEKFLFMPTK
jgi:hypothetical protein